MFFYSIFSLLSLQFILFSSLSSLFSLTSVFSPLFSMKNGINLHRFSSLSRHHQSIIADLSPVAFCTVIADLSGHCHHHRRSESTWASTLRWDRNRRWGEIGVFITFVGIDVEILIVGIDVKVRWDLDRGLPVLVRFGCRCKWIRGFGLAMLVVSWVFFA